MRGLAYILCLFSLLFFLSSFAEAQALYGAANGLSQGMGPSSLYSIDPDTGAATLIGPIGFNNVTGMAFLNDGRLVASANGDALFGAETAILIEIDPTTGAGTLIGIIDDDISGNCGRIPDLTYDTTTDTLYGYGDFCNHTEGPYRINTTTAAGTVIGPSGYSGGGNGIAIKRTTGIIFATPFDTESLVILNSLTGAGADVPGSVGNVPGIVNALDFNPQTGVLFGSLRDAGDVFGGQFYLVTINTSNGVTTPIGETVPGLDAIVFKREPVVSAVPALSEWGMLAVAAGLMIAGVSFAARQRNAKA
jgi:hypothetical protein